MMNSRRTILYFALAIVLFLLWSAWKKEHTSVNNLNSQEVTEDNFATFSDASVPTGNGPPTEVLNKATSRDQDKESTNAIMITSTTPESRIVRIKTDVIEVSIDKKGGALIGIKLLKYPDTLKSKTPITLLSNQKQDYFIVQGGLISKQGPDTQHHQAIYTAEQSNYTLLPDQKTLKVDLNWKDDKGLQVTKCFLFEQGKYAIGIDYTIKNNSSQEWVGNAYAQIRQKQPEHKKKMFALNTFTGAAISTTDKPYKKISYDKMREANVDQTTKGGWLAFQKRYFVAAFAPDQNKENHYYSRNGKNDIYTLGVIGPTLKVKAGDTHTTSSIFYAGPEIAKNLENIAPHLDLTIDYGWLWFISVAIFWVMDHIHKLVGNWGVSIILVTVLIKLIFYKLSATSYRSMARMQKLSPQMARLKEQYKDDKQKLSQETMALYKREKVNPLGGCLPMIIQIPFFFALYYVLIESVQLRQAPFIFWIHDLSTKDPFYVLPILMGLSMLLQQKLNPTPPDPMQAKIMMLMPIMFTVFFLTFPSGLVLYWLTNNCLSILQQWWIMRLVQNKK